MGIVLDWLAKHRPDVLALQETKVRDAEFPAGPFREAGWNVVYRGQKSYNGVAFVSKEPLAGVRDRLYPGLPEEDARYIECECRGVRIFNTYIPQGASLDSPKFQFKLKYLADLKEAFAKSVKPSVPALWVGDMNVAQTEIDLARPKENQDHVCFHADARRAFRETAGELWIDLFREKEKGPGHYTFWDYRFPTALSKNLGWRIDLILGTRAMAGRLREIWIDRDARKLEKPSDHTFLKAVFSAD
ncbi:MAG: exodeoxyribonuclease III [Elusimicrobia bacterium RIFCSPLOWO2_01_FULL_64_13]|nr:MAG: exodeoxyribonuclease III [Elusimicrobia bacterium RIFCSPHIGHO2_01_FULL_64_10]OGR95120.1 MAG: exodeoxyribonuclease III [Elusimicrobia bacterium RIFCSPLOWO2_01_FULL_64_13]